MAKIAISLSDSELAQIEASRKSLDITRSEFFRRAALALIAAHAEQQMDAEYVRSYLEQPETEEELEFAMVTARAVFAANPWEEDDAD